MYLHCRLANNRKIIKNVLIIAFFDNFLTLYRFVLRDRHIKSYLEKKMKEIGDELCETLNSVSCAFHIFSILICYVGGKKFFRLSRNVNVLWYKIYFEAVSLPDKEGIMDIKGHIHQWCDLTKMPNYAFFDWDWIK